MCRHEIGQAGRAGIGRGELNAADLPQEIDTKNAVIPQDHRLFLGKIQNAGEGEINLAVRLLQRGKGKAKTPSWNAQRKLPAQQFSGQRAI